MVDFERYAELLLKKKEIEQELKDMKKETIKALSQEVDGKIDLGEGVLFIKETKRRTCSKKAELVVELSNNSSLNTCIKNVLEPDIDELKYLSGLSVEAKELYDKYVKESNVKSVEFKVGV